MGLKKKQAHQKIKFYENNRELYIEFKWFTPIAFFLIFFCIAWDSFLIFWYSMAGEGEAPLIFFIFPVGHIAVGVGLTYYTICLFINKTFIAIDDDTVKIKHAPLPWLGGKKIPVSDIEQLYVKEKINNNSGMSHSYELRCILTNDEDVKLISDKELGISNSASNAKMLERKIEKFLGIQDYSVEGEYGANEKLKINQVRRVSRKKLNPISITLNDLKKGYILNYDSKTWETVYQTQYDWKSGETDNLYSLTNESHDSMLLYVQNRLGVCAIWIEQKVELFQLESAILTKYNFKNLPSKMEFDGINYLKKEMDNGKQFITDGREGSNIEQCFFVSADKIRSLRLIKQIGSTLIAFTGNHSNEYKFSNILPK